MRCKDKAQKTQQNVININTRVSSKNATDALRDPLDLWHDHGLLYSGRALAGLCVYVCLCAC